MITQNKPGENYKIPSYQRDFLSCITMELIKDLSWFDMGK